MGERVETYWVRTTADGAASLRGELRNLVAGWCDVYRLRDIAVARHRDVAGDVMVFVRHREDSCEDESTTYLIERFLESFGAISRGKWLVETHVGLESPERPGLACGRPGHATVAGGEGE